MPGSSSSGVLARHPARRRPGGDGLQRLRGRGECRRWRRSGTAIVAAVRCRRARQSRPTPSSWRCPDTLAARGRAGAGRARRAGLRSLRRVPAARRGVPRSGGIRTRRTVDVPLTYGLTERYRDRAAGCDARSRAPAAIRPRPSWRCSRSSPRACSSRGIIIDAKSGVSGAGQDADRADALLRVPRQHLGLRRVRAPARAPRSSRSSACR